MRLRGRRFTFNLYPISLTIMALCSACSNTSEESLVHKIMNESTTVQHVVLSNPIMDTPFNSSLSALVQANRNHILIAAARPYEGSIAFAMRYPFTDSTYHLNGLIREGSGPFEARALHASSKTIGGDTIAFLAFEDAKLIWVDEDLNRSERVLQADFSQRFGDVFAYQGGMVAYSMNPRTGDGYLIGIHHIVPESTFFGIQIRVPVDYQPAIRNRVFSIAPIPDGFAVAFLGDRQIYLLNTRAEITNILVLGESDPIGEPYLVSNPMDAPPSRPHIPKIEYDSGILHVLMDGELLFIDLEKRTITNRLAFVDTQNQPVVPLEFSISGQDLIIRVGRNELYKVGRF